MARQYPFAKTLIPVGAGKTARAALVFPNVKMRDKLYLAAAQVLRHQAAAHLPVVRQVVRLQAAPVLPQVAALPVPAHRPARHHQVLAGQACATGMEPTTRCAKTKALDGDGKTSKVVFLHQPVALSNI